MFCCDICLLLSVLLCSILFCTGSEIEVAVVAKGKKLRKLTNEEIEDRLNSISEKSEL